jgi:hypothetical protein
MHPDAAVVSNKQQQQQQQLKQRMVANHCSSISRLLLQLQLSMA